MTSGVAVLAVGTGSAVYALRDDDRAPASTGTTLPTVPVKRTDLSSAAQVDGSLGYADSYTVLGSGSGRITWLPAPGKVIVRGKAVYGVDGHPVPLFYGAMPFWRPLRSGMGSGNDVLELEQNLTALGYGPGLTVDRTFTSSTRSAIEKWQEALRVPQTGSVSPTDVVLMPGPIRVTSVTAVPGGPAAGTVLTASGTTRQVTVKMPVSSQEIAKKGAKVQIELPGGKSTAGHVSSVGTVATADKTNAQSQTGESTESATITVTVTLDESADAGTLDGAPVTVEFTSVEHRDVLAVPVNALLAAADGSYSVNVVDDSGTITSVPVELGVFDGDDVEVTGDLTEGAKVQVPVS
ncbi:efflux RND transporter periplasmic adaptor subunit [Plantactinospora alkalitolerans]|uniref:efflux RND transporter periplasmic adaptor subunit n=1 Tax=Plantactinospora alkalitolerans TaxID=2789879 RepID=UPI002B20BA69|nr:peptidoglycan-binding protein [Plantactinospora alkalitolerans]